MTDTQQKATSLFEKDRTVHRDKAQNTQVLSFPAGKTHELVTSTLIHAHPIKRGFPKEVCQFLNLRATGGFINAVYEVVNFIEGQPEDVLKTSSHLGVEIHQRIKQYIETRRSSFGFSSEGSYDYRFYILALHTSFNPPYQQIPNLMSYTYMSLEELLSKTQVMHNQEHAKKEDHYPGVWLISANGKMYDHATSFATNGFIDWRQNANYNIGDIVYIYCTRPLMQIMYKCEVVEHSKPFSQCIDDSIFWLDKNEYKKSKDGKYARLKLLEQVDTPTLGLDALHNHGLVGTPQGPRKISHSLYSYIDSHFNDYYSEGIFTDVADSKEYHEGHVRTVKVDIYERSSIARRKCIEYNGCSCIICGLDFGKQYGELGAGFIHVHHLKPLHTIGKDYVVNYKTDLIPVCPNCHAMIHRIPGGEAMTVEDLRKTLTSMQPTKRIQPVFSAAHSQQKIDDKIPAVVTSHYTDNPPSTSVTDIKYVGRRVFHTSPKFGPGIITGDTQVTVRIKFDNGVSTTFTKESFIKGLLKFTD